MRLEIEKTNIQTIKFGPRTECKDGELIIDREELMRLLEKDSRLLDVDLDIALPGERCRILQVTDIIEPRYKPGTDMNGTGTSEIGSGVTRALKGMAVLLCDNRESAEIAYGAIIEMSGPSVEVSPFSRTCNLVLLTTPRPGLSDGEYQVAIKEAGLKAGEYLAEAAFIKSPDEISEYDLPSLNELGESFGELPKVVYIPQIFSQQFVAIPGEPVLFGRQADGIIPTLIHPNQFLDGAVKATYPALNITTYDLQNSPIIEALYRRHGHDLCFCGVIVTLAPNNVADFNLMADLVASLAKNLVNADGAILTKCGGGAPELVMARAAQQCELLGIKTVIAMLNMGADIKDHKYGAATIFNFPEVDAIVSMGTPYADLKLPAVDKVIGKLKTFAGNQASDGEIFTSIGTIKGSMCQLGSSKLSAVRY